MLPEKLEALKDLVLRENPVFQNGYANAYRDELRNAIYKRLGNGMQILLPNDSIGNYFYLRHEDAIQHEPMPAERLADSGSQRLTFLDTATVQLVAIVRGACEYVMAENLRNTLMMYQEMNAQPTATIVDRSKAILSELPQLKPDAQLALLQRLSDQTIVRITFKASSIYVPSNCINNPCHPKNQLP